MRTHISWDNRDRTVVRCEMLHGWAWADLARAMLRAERLEREQGRRIDVILDLRDAQPLVNASLFTPQQIASGRTFARLTACYARQIAIVGATPMIRAMFTHYHAACTVETSHVTFARTLDEARERIAAEQRREIIYAVVASA